MHFMICTSVAILFPSSSYFWNHFLVRASRCWFLYHQSWSTQCSACIRSLSSPEISQRASSSLFTLKHLTDSTTPAANVHSIRSWLPHFALDPFSAHTFTYYPNTEPALLWLQCFWGKMVHWAETEMNFKFEHILLGWSLPQCKSIVSPQTGQ